MFLYAKSDTKRPRLNRVDTLIPLLSWMLLTIWIKQTSALDIQPTSNANTYVNSLTLCMSDMQTGITVPANECAAHHSFWQENPCWLTACFCCGEHRFRGLLKRQNGSCTICIRCEKGMSSLWCLFKTFLQAPDSPCLCLHCTQIMFPELSLTSGVESFSSLLAIIQRAHQLSWNINWKGKNAVRHFLTYQFDFRQR